MSSAVLSDSSCSDAEGDGSGLVKKRVGSQLSPRMSDGLDACRPSVTLSLRAYLDHQLGLDDVREERERAHIWIVMGSESGTRSPRSAGPGDGRRFSFSLKLLTPLSDDATLLRTGRTKSCVGLDVGAGDPAAGGGEVGERASSQKAFGRPPTGSGVARGRGRRLSRTVWRELTAGGRGKEEEVRAGQRSTAALGDGSRGGRTYGTT